MTTSPAHPVLRWFTGKARVTIEQDILPVLAAAVARGEWGKGESRRVIAALNKQAAAKKFACEHEVTLTGISNNRKETWEAKLRGWDLAHAMMFGAVSHAPACLDLAQKLEPLCIDQDERDALAVARGWAEDFAPIAAQITTLNATRPKPVFVLGSLSRLVADNVGRAMKVDFDSIALPEMVFTYDEIDGQRFPVVEIIWPEGTRHSTSKFAHGNHCHACGHEIRNPFNWVPLVAQTPAGPVSLWVGSDCARNLFAVEISGGKCELRAGDLPR